MTHPESPEEREESPARSFELIPPKRLNFGIIFAVVLTAGMMSAFAFMTLETYKAMDRTNVLFALLVSIGLPLALILFPALLRKIPAEQRIELGADALSFPDPHGKKGLLPYAEIVTIDLRPMRRGALLIIASPSQRLIVSTQSFAVSGQQDALIEAIRREVALRPGGERRLAEIDRMASLSKGVLRRPVPVTNALFAIIIGVYIVEIASGALDRPLGLLMLGANAPALVEAGQIYRLFTANFIHLSPLHIFMNVTALLGLGPMIERLVGSRAYLAIYLAGGLGGSLASTISGRALLSAGASTSLFGLLGSLAALGYQYRSDLPDAFRRPRSWWIYILGINALLPVILPQIDYVAHIGGLVAGGLVTLLVTRGRTLGPDGISTAPLARAAAWMLSAAHVAAFGIAGQHAMSDPAVDETLIIRSLVQDARSNSDLLNEIAWTAAIDPGASPAILEAAREAISRAVPTAGSDRQEAAYVDTLATVDYRLGHLDKAIEAEARALSTSPANVFATQLARFVLAAHRGTTTSSIARIAGDGGDRLELAENTGAIRTLIVPSSGGRPLGLIDVCLDSARHEALTLELRGERLTGIDRPGVDLVAHTASVTPCPTNRPRPSARAFGVDPSVLEWP
jgi:rhomboid protease GluP